MATKLYDLAVVASSYTNMAGQKKNNWLNVGAVYQDDKGGKFITLKTYYNFDAFPKKEGSESIIISMFEPKDKQQQQQQQPHNFAGANHSNKFNTSAENISPEMIPF